MIQTIGMKRLMNKTEGAYAWVLEARKRAKEIRWYEFEVIKLKLAQSCYYTPDFFVMTAEGNLEVHEVKGFWRDDARVKIKVAAKHFPFKFIGVQRKNNSWVFEEF
jgi:hypothetical protein